MEAVNCFELIHGYYNWKYDNSKLTAIHDAVFHALLYIDNRLGWKKEFSITMRELTELVGCSYNPVHKAINDLAEFGFIKFVRKSRNQYQTNIICFIQIKRSTSKALNVAQVKHLKSTGEAPQKHLKHSLNNKQYTLNNKHQTINNNSYPLKTDSEIFEEKEKEKIAVKEKEKIDLPFETHEFERAWQTWKRYKYEQHKFTYKSSVTEQTALGNLARLSGGKELTALKIIEQSISNGWQGFFELKNEQQNGTKSNDQRRQDLAEVLMEEFGRTRNSNNGSTGNTKV